MTPEEAIAEGLERGYPCSKPNCGVWECEITKAAMAPRGVWLLQSGRYPEDIEVDGVYDTADAAKAAADRTTVRSGEWNYRELQGSGPNDQPHREWRRNGERTTAWVIWYEVEAGDAGAHDVLR